MSQNFGKMFFPFSQFCLCCFLFCLLFGKTRASQFEKYYASEKSMGKEVLVFGLNILIMLNVLFMSISILILTGLVYLPCAKVLRTREIALCTNDMTLQSQ